MNAPIDFGAYWWKSILRKFIRTYCVGMTEDETLAELARRDGQEIFPNVWIKARPDGSVRFLGGKREVEQCAE